MYGGSGVECIPRPSNIDARPSDCLMVIDTGFSNTTVTPYYRGKPIQQAIRRLNIGGKSMTNRLKDDVSVRQYNMQDEFYIMNECKERMFFVTTDYDRDLELTWKNTSYTRRKELAPNQEILLDYVLPDYSMHKTPYARPHIRSLSADAARIAALAGAGPPVDEYLILGNERFGIVEGFFNGVDGNIMVDTLAEAVIQSASLVQQSLWSSLMANILVVGGNALIPGFMPRLYEEVRRLVPLEVLVRLNMAPDPVKSTWLGGAYLAQNAVALKEAQITRQEYLEYGGSWVARAFQGAA